MTALMFWCFRSTDPGLRVPPIDSMSALRWSLLL